jgi:anti-sigma28 factor (negative regulator of flagellin synthesis)
MHKGSTLSKSTHSNGAAAAPAKDRTDGELREARISELREQYLAGDYKVDAKELSRKIVESHLRK